ncbi:hypothetical protein ScPMuIL_017767 [Solemya velum]
MFLCFVLQRSSVEETDAMGGYSSRFSLQEDYGNPAASVNIVDQSKVIDKDHDVQNLSQECENPNEDAASVTKIDQSKVNDKDHDVQNAPQERVQQTADGAYLQMGDHNKMIQNTTNYNYVLRENGNQASGSKVDQSNVNDSDHDVQNAPQEYANQAGDVASGSKVEQTKVNDKDHDVKNASQVKKTRIPGKPMAQEVGIDNITLVWSEPADTDVEFYEMKFKRPGEKKWCKTSFSTDDAQAYFRMEGLCQDTEYEFKVRPNYGDYEGEFSETSETIKTKQSEALKMLELSQKLEGRSPDLYRLPLVLDQEATCEEQRTRKYVIGQSDIMEEKTIMMIGATGAGKSTLIDGIANYLLGVKWEDNFRFKLINPEDDEQACVQNQTHSQTSWITSYKIHPMNDTVDFVLNIIDTPGFGDTKGLVADQKLVEQITYFFKTAGRRGVETIDAVCFVAQAPGGRLTCTQMYINDSILSIFGKDIAENIVAMVTFADGKEPPVLEALREAGVPFRRPFKFNNSALFTSNKDSTGFEKMFWEMGVKSYSDFFTFLPSCKTQSLQLTAEILQCRERVLAVIAGLRPRIDKGLMDLDQMERERKLLDTYDSQIKDNENFTYRSEEFHQKQIQLQQGTYVTNCVHCNTTCHYPCGIPNNEEKHRCASMKWGKCTVCEGNCSWKLHRNNEFRIEPYLVEVEKTYENMKEKYEFAKKHKVSKTNWIDKIKAKYNKRKNAVLQMLGMIRKESNYLRKHAIKANPLSDIEYIDLLIKQELAAKKPGYNKRHSQLLMFRENAKLTFQVTTTDDDKKVLNTLGLQDTVV